MTCSGRGPDPRPAPEPTVPHEHSPYGLPGALLEPPPPRIVLRAEHPVAAMVRGRRRSHQHSIFPVPAEHPLAPDPVGRGVYEHQPVSDLAHLHGATPGGAVPSRADTLRHGVPLAYAARLRRPRHGGRMERWGDR